jgi:hypothetical protein
MENPKTVGDLIEGSKTDRRMLFSIRLIETITETAKDQRRGINRLVDAALERGKIGEERAKVLRLMMSAFNTVSEITDSPMEEKRDITMKDMSMIQGISAQLSEMIRELLGDVDEDIMRHSNANASLDLVAHQERMKKLQEEFPPDDPAAKEIAGPVANQLLMLKLAAEIGL